MSFQLLVSRGGLRQWPSPAAKGALDQEVGEMWVLGEQRAVQIRPEDVARDDTLGSILPIVAGAVQDLGTEFEPVDGRSDPPADTVPGLVDRHPEAPPAQLARRREPRNPRPDHRDVDQTLISLKPP